MDKDIAYHEYIEEAAEQLRKAYAPFMAMMNGGKNMVEGINIPGVKFAKSEVDPAAKYMMLPDGLRLIFRNGVYDGYIVHNTQAKEDNHAKKVYIAGKITGDPNYREKFFCAQAKLEEAGHIVLTPATMPEGMKPEDYMRICLAMIDTADVVCFLPNWDQSLGAMLEHNWCEYTGKKIATITELTKTEEEST